ncbi:hypothetical protein [Streptomyces sp. NPDC002889]|uniref:hypothetical protein n=1 Tax=Streptomyces sp. NPDC002889 TaxID=3364669 RepID=UPI00368A269A
MRAARLALWGLLPAELVPAFLLVAGIPVPPVAVAVAEALILAVLVLELSVLLRLYAAARRAGAVPRDALLGAVRDLVPTVLARLVVHELRAMHSLGLWLARRRNGVPPGAHPAAYTGPQTALMYGMIFVSVIETVALAFLIPWPLVHAITLVIDVYGVLLLVAMQAACVTRPHVVGADGSLRIRYGALFDLRIAADEIVRARVERRYPDGRLVTLREDGVLEVIVAGQTTVAVDLTGPLAFVRPLGRRGTAHTVRFHADDPKAVVAALMSAVGRRAPGASGSAAGPTAAGTTTAGTPTGLTSAPENPAREPA